MSLKVWLPLDGDLRNLGCSDVTVTNNGATVNDGGKIGKCYSFTNNNIVIPSTNFKNNFTNNQASLTVWVKISTSHSAYAQALVLGTQGTSWNNILFGIDINGSGIPIAVASTGSANTTLSFNTAIKDETWHHLAYTYNNGKMTVYLDGIQKATGNTSNTPAWVNSSNLYIGGNSGGEKFVHGDLINDVRLYNHCLSAAEVHEISQGLILHYKLDDIINGIIDSSGYGHHGAITGNITTSISTPRYSACNNFPDSACSIGIGNLSTMIPEGIFTFNIWFKKVTNEWSSKNYETILGGPSGFELEGKNGSTNSPVIRAYNWGGSTFPYTLDEWHMLTMVRTTSDTKFYLDGELKLTGSAGSIPSGNYFIGAWSNAASQNYRGYLSDARIYCTPLLDNDIKMLYNVGMKVDNLGGVHTFEFNEISNEKLLKTGILQTNELEETSIQLARLQKDKGWLSSEFIEI